MYRDEAVPPRCTTLSYSHMMLRYGKRRLSLFKKQAAFLSASQLGKGYQTGLLSAGSHHLPLAGAFQPALTVSVIVFVVLFSVKL